MRTEREREGRRDRQRLARLLAYNAGAMMETRFLLAQYLGGGSQRTREHVLCVLEEHTGLRLSMIRARSKSARFLPPEIAEY